jgi:tetratricopeptide (TPR) repeat protein
LNPTVAEVHNNLGIALAGRGKIDEAITAHRRSIALKPQLAKAHHNLGIALLTRGDFQEGWAEYEWRWKCEGVPRLLRNFSQPQWDGGPLEGRIILLHAEQGFGDAIKFIRYVPLVAQRGGRVIIVCFAELERLFQAMPGAWQIVGPGHALPAFDLHAPLLSLPRILETTLSNIPRAVPYLQADADQATKWKHRLSVYPPCVNVGLVWAGRPTQRNDRNRSVQLARFAPLGQVAGIRFFSLQKGTAAAEAKAPPEGIELVDWTEDLKDFADTAALIANLDIVISVDTAVAHLAGAMGKPIWALLSSVPGWHWMLEREDSPWYPSMRLFRQPSLGDWDSVFKRLAEALFLWLNTRS